MDTDWCGTLETGSVELSDLGAAVAEGTAEAVEAAKADLIAGKTHVYDITTFTVDGKTLDSYEADIDTDPDYTPDHEVVSDGYFHESDVAFRSAPFLQKILSCITPRTKHFKHAKKHILQRREQFLTEYICSR